MSEPKRALTIDDVISLPSITDPQLSPDGTTIAYVVSGPGRVGKLTSSHVWRVDANAEMRPVQLTHGSHHDSRPRWSPDGRTLAFLSDRASRDVCQVYLLTAEMEEARQVTDVPHGVTSFAWSPTHHALACIVKDEREEAPHEPGAPDSRPFESNLPVNRLHVVALAGEDTPTASIALPCDLHVLDFDWAPNGEALVVAGTREPRIDAAFREVQIVRLPLDGSPTFVLATSNGAESEPRWSPDGMWVAFKSGLGRAYSALALCVVPAAGGVRRCLTEQFEGSVFTYRWLPDSTSLLAITQEDLCAHVRRIDLEGGFSTPISPQQFSTGGADQSYLTMGSNGQSYVTVIESDHQPRSAWLGSLDGALRRVSANHKSVDEIQLGEVRTVEWSSESHAIRGALVLPPNYQKGHRYPLVVQLHGGPAGVCHRRFQVAWHEWAQILATHGIAVLRPNPRGSSGRGFAFLEANRGDWGDGPLQDVMAGVDRLIDDGFADADRLGIGGWSYGGYLTAWAVTRTQRFRAAVIGAPVVNLLSFLGTTDIPFGFLPSFYYDDPYRRPALYHEQSPLYRVDEVTTPILLLHGEADKRVPLGQSIELYTALRGRQKEVQFVTYPREEHAILEPQHQRDVVERMVAWYRTHLDVDAN